MVFPKIIRRLFSPLFWVSPLRRVIVFIHVNDVISGTICLYQWNCSGHVYCTSVFLYQYGCVQVFCGHVSISV